LILAHYQVLAARQTLLDIGFLIVGNKGNKDITPDIQAHLMNSLRRDDEASAFINRILIFNNCDRDRPLFLPFSAIPQRTVLSLRLKNKK
jgi:hypothetical protein